MTKVIAHASLYNNVIDSLEADIYMKGERFIEKKNFLMRFAHHAFPVERNPSNSMSELFCHTHFQNPNKYRHDIEAVNGTSRVSIKRCNEILSFVCFNIYSPTIYDKEIITPISKSAFKYYNFTVENIEYVDGDRVYKIKFEPHNWSQRLLNGYLYINENLWRVEHVEMSGHTSFSEFTLTMDFDVTSTQFILPRTATLDYSFGALGNWIRTSHHASFLYHNIAWRDDFDKKIEESLDLTRYYSIKRDSVPIVKDSSYWAEKRDVPLTEEEETLYAQKSAPKKHTKEMPFLKMGERLTGPMATNFNTTQLRYSGIMNPVQFSYSGSNGVTYRQQLKITKSFDSGRQLRFRPEVGYMFKKKWVRFSASLDFEYMPTRKGTISFLVANGNHSYSWQVMENIKEELKGLGYKFDGESMKPFSHYYSTLNHSIELLNGLQFGVGASYHRRVSRDKELPLTIHDFAPTLSLTWTPKQYYWMDGYRKEYLYSNYPTFSVEFSKGIPNILGSTSRYGMVELTAHQSLRVALSSKLSYHVSGGLFFDRKSLDFADFRYFAKRYFPESWGDRFGGVFHNLSGGWYNASHKYVQAHLMYDSPFILLNIFKATAHKFLLSERLYLSQLSTPVLPSYTEIGYGIGSDIFNIAVFTGFEKASYRNIGVKFTFEMF
jgi:hypothetical protein